MKTKAILFFASTFLLAFSCQDAVQQQINELHTSTMQLMGEFSPQMEELNQRAISINIQGRALTDEEMSFVDEVAALEGGYNDWLSEMETVMAMPNGKERLEKEQSLNDSIVAFKKKAEELMGTN